MINRFIAKSQFFYLHLLHMCNDGYNAGLILLLPFIAKDLHFNLTEVGILGALLSVIGIILAMPAAYLGNRLGGGKTLLLALFMYAVGFVALGFASSYLWLFPVYVLIGLGFGLFHPVGFAMIAHGSKKEERGTNMGNFTALGEVGRVGVSAAVTILVVWWGWHMTSIAYGIIALLLGCFFIIVLRKKNNTLTIGKQSKQTIGIKALIAHKGFIYASLTCFFDAFASSPLFVFLPFLLLHKGVDPALLGTFAGAFFVGTFAGKSALGRLTDRFGSTTVFIISELLMAIFIVLIATTTNLVMIIIYSLILGIFTKGTVPISKTMIVEASEHHGDYQKAFGVNSVVSNIGAGAAPVLLGIISDNVGIVTAFFVMACAAILSIVPAILFRVAQSRESSTATQ